MKKRIIKLQKYSFETFKHDIDTFSTKLSNTNIEVVVAIARGGVTLGHFLASKLDIRELYIVNAISYDDKERLYTLEVKNIPNLQNFKNVLLVDDISDSGETLKAVTREIIEQNPSINLTTLTLYYKKSSSFAPDIWLHEANEWIEFFWEY